MVGTYTGVLLADTVLVGHLIIIVYGYVSRLQNCICFGKHTDVEAKLSWCDGPVTPEEKSTEHWLGEEIQDAVENGFAIRCDDITTFCESPSDGVEEPQEDCEDAASQVRTSDVGTQSIGVAAAKEDQYVYNVQEREHAEGEESPLRLGQRQAYGSQREESAYLVA